MTEAGTRPRRRDRTFGPTVLAGLAGAGGLAVAGAREWAVTQGDAAGMPVDASATGAESEPLVAAAALVALAGWGVVLVLRGRMRRVVAAIGLLAAAGALVGVVLGLSSAREDSVAAAVARGATGDAFTTSLTPWYWLAGLGALMTTAAFAVAVARAPLWPAMGSRYDAPSAPVTPEQEGDMWRALDEGRDPTA